MVTTYFLKSNIFRGGSANHKMRSFRMPSQETIITLESLHFKKSISLIGSRKQVAEARSFHKIDNHVVTEHLSYKHSCNNLNRFPKAKTAWHIFSWSALPYSFSTLFIVAFSELSKPRVFRLTAFCANYVN